MYGLQRKASCFDGENEKQNKTKTKNASVTKRLKAAKSFRFIGKSSDNHGAVIYFSIKISHCERESYRELEYEIRLQF